MSQMSHEELKSLALKMAAVINIARAEKTNLRLVKTARPTQLDAITRESYLRRIRLLGRHCQLYWMIDQACFSIANLDCLEDPLVIKLLEEMERARECSLEGIPFEDADLVINIFD